MTKLLTVAEMARLKQMTRQGMSQALARSIPALKPEMTVGGAGNQTRLYDPDDFESWWQQRIQQIETRIPPAPEPTAQMNIRLRQSHYETLQRIRLPGESTAAAGLRAFIAGLETLAVQQ